MASSLAWVGAAFKSRPIQYIIFLLVIVLLIYVIGRQAGRNSFADYKPKDLPEEPNWSPDIFVEEAWDILDGYTDLAAYKEEFFVKLLGLSDRQLNEIYNLYNSRYGKSDGYTLTKKIANETNVFWTGRRDDLVKRLRTLKLY